VNGRKRHLLVDVLGLVLLVIVHAARVQEQAGAQRVFERIQGRHPRLRLVWADAGYKVQWLLDWVQTTCAWILEMVSRPEGSQGFVLLPRRWVVERSFGWLSHYRVLSKDYAVLPRNREAVVYVAMIHISWCGVWLVKPPLLHPNGAFQMHS
jgi:putative transposase